MRRLLRVRLIATTLSLLAWSAHAATTTIERSETVAEPAIILLQGDIATGDEAEFIDRILGIRNAVIVLYSGGGSLDTAIQIGQAIRIKQFVTLVLDDAVCASACALIWLSGQPRFMAAKAQIGFHAAFDLENGTPRERGAPNAVVGAYLSELGFSQRAILYLTSAPPNEMQWLSTADAAEFGIDVQSFPTDQAALSKPLSEPPAPEPLSTEAQQPGFYPGFQSDPDHSNFSVPKFRSYPAKPVRVTRRVAVDLSTPETRMFRTRLRRAAKEAPNFAGHYVMTWWGCGTTCVIGAAVDLFTGKVVFLPGSICCWSAEREGSHEAYCQHCTCRAALRRRGRASISGGDYTPAILEHSRSDR